MLGRLAYPLDETGELLGGLSRATLYNMRKRGEIEFVKIGRRTLVPLSEIERLVAPTTKEESSDDPSSIG